MHGKLINSTHMSGTKSFTHHPLPTVPPAGALLPGFHRLYWLGLAVATRWPAFTWLDLSPQPPLNTTRGAAFDESFGGSPGVYAHWGYYMPQNIIEPNNLTGLEECAVANASQTYGSAWGWADTRCSASLPYMCRITREQGCCAACWTDRLLLETC